MMRNKLLGMAATALLTASGLSSAEDIDLFIGVQNEDAGLPSVLLVLDNASNFSSNAAGATCIINGVETKLSGTVGGIEQCALYKVIEALPEDRVNIGIMVYNDSSVRDWEGSPCVSSPSVALGGCLVFPIMEMTADNKAALLAYIEQWTTNSSDPAPFKRIDGNNKRNGSVMQEAWAYLRGDRTGLSGRAYPTRSPDGVCGSKDYVVFVGNSYSSSGQPGDASVSNGKRGAQWALEGLVTTTNQGATPLMNAVPAATAAQRALMIPTISSSCGSATLSGGNNHQNNGYYQDEWARYMKQTRNITTYTVGVLGPSCQANYAALLTNTATAGGGQYFPTTDYGQLELAFQSIFSQILAVNTVFASVSLPISVNTEDTFLNQIYIGMFRPDEDAKPRWTGNLKQYRLGIVGGSLRLVDARNPLVPAISSAGTGFLDGCTVSFWNAPTADSYWNPGVVNCPGSAAASNLPDGYVVEKGGQGYWLRGLSSHTERNVKTCANSSGTLDCDDVDDFDTSNAAITAGLLGVDAATRDAVIDWARGANNCTGAAAATDPGSCPVELVAGGTTANVRPSVHGDVLHSRPRALNYGTEAEPKVVVFYGANDGTLRAVNGNRGTEADPEIAGVEAGGELWSFMPREFLGQINRIRNNGVPINFFGFASGEPKPYGFDGPVTSLVEVDPDTKLLDTAIVYATLRRGGRMVYAFDVSNIADDRESPFIAWRFGCDETGTCTGTEAEDIGQTWSAPQVLRWEETVQNPRVSTPLVMLSGGYDTCEDSDPHDCASDATPQGRKIYVLDAVTGEHIRTFDTDRPVVGDVFVVPDADEIAQYAYAADLGGNIYRISAPGGQPFSGADPLTWEITTIARLGCDATATCAANRKFFFAPDVVKDGANGYVLLIGSGDREKPLQGYRTAMGVENYFFMLRDKPWVANWVSGQELPPEDDGTGGSGCFDPVICLDSLPLIPNDGPADAVQLADPQKRGWRLAVRPNEQVVTSAITVFGTVTFSTHEPRTQACEPDLGTARAYQVNYLNADAPLGPLNRSTEVQGGGLPPSPVAGLVRLDDGTVVPFLIGGSGLSPLEAGLPSSAAFPDRPKGRTYWYISNE